MATRQLMFDILAKSDKVDKTFKDIVDSADTMSGKLKAAGKKSVAGAFDPKVGAAAGAAAGAALTRGFMVAMDEDTVTRDLSAGMGLDPKQQEAAGAAVGGLYADAYGESMQEVGHAVETVMSSFSGMRDASESDIEAMTGKAMSLAKTLDSDVSEAAAAAGVMMETGLAKDPAEAMDLLAAASEKVPKAMRSELIPVLNEYSKDFETLGIGGPQAMGLIADAAAGGAIQMDKTGDALKEFSIRASDLEDTGAQEALEGLGLSGKDMANQILAGGDTAAGAFDEIVKGLQGIEDPGKQAAAATALFGTPLEDIGKDKIPGFLEALASADGGLGETAGKARELDEALQEGPAAGLKQFQRAVDDSLGALVESALPAMTPVLEGLKEFAPIIGPLVIALGALAVVIGVVNAVMALNPITWIVIGIVALIAALALLIANWDTVVAWVSEIWGGFLIWLGEQTMGFIEGWNSMWASVGEFLSGLWSGIVDGATGMIDDLVTFFTELPGKILAVLSGAGQWLVDVGKNMIDGLLDGIASMAGNIGSFFLDLLPGWIVGPFKTALGIHSPSKVFAGYGENIGEGVLVGVGQMAPDIDSTMQDLVNVPDTGGPEFGQLAAAQPGGRQEAPAQEVTFAPVFQVESDDAEELFQKLWTKFRSEARKQGVKLGTV